MKAQRRQSRILLALLILLSGLELAAPFVVRPAGVDGPGQLNLEAQFNSLIARGVLIPRWVPEGFHGFGSPAFYFYPPIAFYLTALLQWLTTITDPRSLFQMAGLVGTIASFFSARYLLSTIGAQGTPLGVGSFLYAFGPFRIAELYSRSSLSSHIGYVFVPLMVAGIVQIFSEDRRIRAQGALLSAIAGALLICTSIPLALLSGVGVVVILAALYREITIRGVLVLFGAGIISILLSGWYLSSVLSYQHYAQLANLTAKREFILDDLLHLRNLPTLYHVAILVSGIALATIAAMSARASFGITTVERGVIRAGLAVAAVIVVLELPFVRSVAWGGVPLLPLVQGSWRFLILLLLALAMFVALATTPKLVTASNAIVWLFTVATLPLAIAIVFNLHMYHHHTDPVTDQMEYAPIFTLKDQTALDRVLSASPQVMLQASAAAPSSDHVTPVSANPQFEEYDIQLAEDRRATFHRFYWPAWHVTAAGREVSSSPDSLGRATITLPGGHYIAHWDLEQSPLERSGMWISGLTLCTMAIAIATGITRRLRK